MSVNKLGLMISAAALLVVACGTPVEDASTNGKPQADPDTAIAGKADGLSNHYTTRMGELPLNDVVFGEIDYPDWFHGYEIDLEEGQTVQFTSWADAEGIVRLYGPSGGGERTRYGRPVVRSYAMVRGERSLSEFDFEVEESGTYMLVYGPSYVWQSTYELSTKCLAGCEVEPPASECDSHDDCEDGFCRQLDWDRASGMACHPYQPEGESCGGFVPPHMVESCGPELNCVFRPFIADAPGRCRNVATVEQIMQDPDAFDGMRVSIDGYVNVGLAICTQLACTPDNPCCNSCGASQVLDDSPLSTDGLELVGDDGATLGCGGDSCDYSENCALDAEGNTRVLGTIEVGEYGNVMLHIEEVTPLEYL